MFQNKVRHITKKKRSFSFLYLFLFLCFIFSSCATHHKKRNSQDNKNKREIHLSLIKSQIGVRKIKKEVNSKLLLSSINNQDWASSVRIVPLTVGGIIFPPPPPSYKIFGIKKGDPFYILGMKNGDTILALNDLVVFRISEFYRWLLYLTKNKEGSLWIKRGKREFIYYYLVK